MKTALITLLSVLHFWINTQKTHRKSILEVIYSVASCDRKELQDPGSEYTAYLQCLRMYIILAKFSMTKVNKTALYITLHKTCYVSRM